MRGHALCTCCFSGHLSWHSYGCFSCYYRCHLEHPLCRVGMSTPLSEHQFVSIGCRFKHQSLYLWCLNRCLSYRLEIFISMLASLCMDSCCCLRCLSDVWSVDLDCNGGHMMLVWMYVRNCFRHRPRLLCYQVPMCGQRPRRPLKCYVLRHMSNNDIPIFISTIK